MILSEPAEVMPSERTRALRRWFPRREPVRCGGDAFGENPRAAEVFSRRQG